jgi:bifunctional non-homologous end joining protein LigD
MGVLEVHTWNSRFASVEKPDRIVIDIDPGEAVGWPEVVETARLVRELFKALELDSFVKTTGGRGLHIVVPLRPAALWSECLDFSRAVAETLVRRQPARLTTRFAKAGRENKLLIDYLRNNRTNTSVAAYSTRARPNATVSVPLTWRELSPARTPDRFTMSAVAARLARARNDPWKDYWTAAQTIPRGAVAALDRL